MRAPLVVYRFCEVRGKIPSWVRWFWPKAHWCPEMDGLLVLSDVENCFCGHARPQG